MAAAEASLSCSPLAAGLWLPGELALPGNLCVTPLLPVLLSAGESSGAEPVGCACKGQV